MASNSGPSFPDWFWSLKPLAPVAAGLATIGSNPEAWAKRVIAQWVVGGFLDGLQYVLGWIIFAFDTVRRAILSALGPFRTPFLILEDAVVGTIDGFYGILQGIGQLAGLAGPPAAAFGVALVSTALAVTVFAVLKVIPGSDLVEGGLNTL